jgi:GxxExxY protein
MTLNELSKVVVDAAFEVRRTLGAGLLESAYETALAHELGLRGIGVERQVPVFLRYKGKEIGEAYRMDLLVDRRLVVECKATEGNKPVYAAQCLTYLRGADLKLGLVVNFGCGRLVDGIERVVNGVVEG